MEKNPFAELANNESLYIDDPKKCLKNWFDREGYDLEYKVEEKGMAQFSCRIELPVDGQPNFAEAEVKGKKKEAVVQAALEACRILDRLGLLKQSQQTRMERKVKKWEDDDFYDSDEDEFLDRTGDIEQKRQKRMKMAGVTSDSVETYDTLTRKLEELEKEQREVEGRLEDLQKQKARLEQAVASEDTDLDSYLANLKKGDNVNKEAVTKLKARLNILPKTRKKNERFEQKIYEKNEKFGSLLFFCQELKLTIFDNFNYFLLKTPFFHQNCSNSLQNIHHCCLQVRLQQLSTERTRLVKLINIAKPTNMPALKSDQPPAAKSSIMIGKMGSKGYIGKIKSVAKGSVAKPVVVPSERTRVLEAFLQEDEEKTKRMRLPDADGEDSELKPIGYEAGAILFSRTE